MAGTVGAIYNAGLQLSTAVGIPIVTAIQVGVNSSHTDTFKGRAAGFWYVMALVAVQALAVAVFYQNRGGGEGGEWQNKGDTKKEDTGSNNEKPQVAIDGNEIV